MGYRTIYLGAGARRAELEQDFATVEEATRGVKMLKRRGMTAWVETDGGEFVPVEGARRKPGERRNPGAVLDVPEDALDKFEEFHRHKPTSVGEFDRHFTIPESVAYCGTSKWVTYRSHKVDPETLRKPKSAVDYIHEHDAGVVTYEVPERGSSSSRTVRVPGRFREAAALVKLGQFLGCCFAAGKGGTQEVASKAPMPDLYCTPDGKCLLVIQGKRKVIMMMWGGALGVFARGIDG